MPRYIFTKTLIFIVVISLQACALIWDSNQGEVLSTIVSKDGQYTALILQGNGGATTAYAYKVLLKNSNSNLPLSRASLIFTSYAYPTPKKIRFIDRNSIEIRCDNGSVFAVSFNERTLNPDRKLSFYKGKPLE